jgi:hypothetical protein
MADGATRETGHAWQGDTLLRAVADRLRRSATIALLVSPIGVLFLSAARLLIIADYNPTTASAIASSGGYVNTLLGTILPLVPLAMPYIALLLLFFNRVIPGLLALLATALISPTAMARSKVLIGRNWGSTHDVGVIGLIVLFIIVVIIAFCMLVTLLCAGFSTLMRIIGLVVCIAILPTITQLYPLPAANKFYTQLLRQPWLPAETITLTSGARFTGYVLADDGAWIEILQDSSRTITYYLPSDITSRQICETSQASAMRPLITLGSGAGANSRLPACQTSAKPAPLSGPGTPAREE